MVPVHPLPDPYLLMNRRISISRAVLIGLAGDSK